MRLINADALKDFICFDVDNTTFSLHDILSYIDAMPTIYPKKRRGFDTVIIDKNVVQELTYNDK